MQRRHRNDCAGDGRPGADLANARCGDNAALLPTPRPTARQVAAALILRHAFIPPDNSSLAHLCGSLDEHLRSIEAALDDVEKFLCR